MRNGRRRDGRLENGTDKGIGPRFLNADVREKVAGGQLAVGRFVAAVDDDGNDAEKLEAAGRGRNLTAMFEIDACDVEIGPLAAEPDRLFPSRCPKKSLFAGRLF